jgi:glycosyltransferase involved in cell wall biosynthesis
MPGRVLIIAYFFPPVGGVGVQRTLKHAIHLPGRGWTTIVVAPRDPAYPLRDPSLLDGVPPGLEVHRTLSLEPSRLTQMARRRIGRGEVAGQLHGDVGIGMRTPRPRGLVQRALRTGATLWGRAWAEVLFPEEAIAWLPSALLSSVRITRRLAIDVLYSSSPPVTTHIVAGLTKRLTGRPWVADFRDPWIGNTFARRESAWRRRLQVSSERWIVQHADAVILSVESLRDDFRKRYPEGADRFVHIPNGYDRADLLDLPVRPADVDDSRFRLVYAGSLYREHELEIFLSGVETLLRRRPVARDRLLIEFVGPVNEANAMIAARYAARLGDVVRYLGFLRRRDALARMASADALLHLMPPDPRAGGIIGAKVLEYLAFDRPILAVVPEGEGRRLVASLPGGRTSAVDPDSIACALEELLDDPPVAEAADRTGRYDRANLAGELAHVLDTVVASARARRRP